VQNMKCTCLAMAAFYVIMEVRDLLGQLVRAFTLLSGESKRIRDRFERGRMSKEEYKEQAKRFKTSFAINISYLVNKKVHNVWEGLF